MAERKNPTRLVMIIAAIAFIILLVYLSRQQNQNQYEVCVSFKGASHCSTAAAANPTEAIRSAQGIDCAMLTNGRDENMVCLDTPPTSTRQIK
ncbi:MAG TPA: hypothetical protein VN875_19755 [Candidatus Binatus sp.]|jgi:hypothetical protein|nr:hypothetical protein [Candidatus Binatus sp.]